MVTQFKLDTTYTNEIVYENVLRLYWHAFVQTVILIFVLFCVVVLGSLDLTNFLLSLNFYLTQSFNHINFCQNARGLRQKLG